MPGRVIEIKVFIVKNEKSSRKFQTIWIPREIKKLIIVDSEISKFPSTNVDVINFRDSFTWGGISFNALVSDLKIDKYLSVYILISSKMIA